VLLHRSMPSGRSAGSEGGLLAGVIRHTFFTFMFTHPYPMKHLPGIALFCFLAAACSGGDRQAAGSSGATAPATAPRTSEMAQLKEKAALMRQHFLAKDYEAYTAFIHPKVIEMIGSREEMVQVLQKTMGDMEAEGMRFQDVRFGTPSAIIRHGRELQCVLPQVIELKVPGGRMRLHASLVAISSDNGATWYFADTAVKDRDALYSMLQLSPDLVIPPGQEPEVIEE